MIKINPAWIIDRRKEITETPKDIDITLSYNPAMQWLIVALSQAGIMYKLYNLGAGVKRITTKEEFIDKCPCCNRQLKQ